MFAEEVIKRRLLIDGDGTGDDRRLSALLKTFLKWSSPEENVSSADRLESNLPLILYNIMLTSTQL